MFPVTLPHPVRDVWYWLVYSLACASLSLRENLTSFLVFVLCDPRAGLFTSLSNGWQDLEDTPLIHAVGCLVSGCFVLFLDVGITYSFRQLWLFHLWTSILESYPSLCGLSPRTSGCWRLAAKYTLSHVYLFLNDSNLVETRISINPKNPTAWIFPVIVVVQMPFRPVFFKAPAHCFGFPH